MKQGDLIPKPPRHWRMKQPRKSEFRWRAELAEARLAYRATPRWWRLFNRIRARLVEVDPELTRLIKERSNG